MRNDGIREDLGVESILELIEKSKLRWYGHVRRMEEGRYAKRFLDWSPECRRPRPRTRWMDGVKYVGYWKYEAWKLKTSMYFKTEHSGNI